MARNDELIFVWKFVSILADTLYIGTFTLRPEPNALSLLYSEERSDLLDAEKE